MKKSLVILLILSLGGCSFFDPSADITNEELLEQYKYKLSEITNVELVKSVKSSDCKFLGYVEPEFKSTPTFGCEVVLEPFEPEKYEDITDTALLSRSGISGKHTHLEKSRFIERVSTEVMNQQIKATSKNNAQ